MSTRLFGSISLGHCCRLHKIAIGRYVLLDSSHFWLRKMLHFGVDRYSRRCLWLQRLLNELLDGVEPGGHDWRDNYQMNESEQPLFSYTACVAQVID